MSPNDYIADFFVLRTPLLPYREIAAWADSAGWQKSMPDGDEQYEAGYTALLNRLHSVFRRKVVQEALFLASPSLYNRFRRADNSDGAASDWSMDAALAKYFLRMAGRSTPFGLFAGISTGRIRNATRVELPPRSRYRRHTRLDMEYLGALAEAVSLDANQRSRIRFRPNDSIVRVGSDLRYSEAKLSDGNRDYSQISVTGHEYIDRALCGARHGVTPEELACQLADETVGRDEARAFVDDLIDSRLLEPDLSPTLTGPNPAEDFLSQCDLQGIDGTVPLALGEAVSLMKGWDERGLGVRPDDYVSLASRLAELPAHVPPGRLFQVDMTKPADVSLDRDLVSEILGGVEALYSLFAAESDGLEGFRTRFTERFGERDIPLLEALDDDLGLGFGAGQNAAAADASPLLDGISFASLTPHDSVTWTPARSYIQRKLSDTISRGQREMVVTPEDLESLPSRKVLPLPDAFELMATVLASEDGYGPVAYLKGLDGPSGARMLGRFCHLDPELLCGVREHARIEESLRSEAAFFEVVHLPDGRMGNVLARPCLRRYELPFQGRSGAPGEQQLDPKDLLVSVVGERIALRSRSLGLEVVPRLSSAHNFRLRSLNVYRFLGSLQGQGVSSRLSWDWGPLLNQGHLPRVRHGRIILSPECWRIRKAEVETMIGASGTDRFKAFHSWGQDLGLPRFLGLVEGDSTLPVDIENPISVDILMDVLERKGVIHLEESFTESRFLLASGPEGRFCNEVVIPVVRRPPHAPPPVADPSLPKNARYSTAPDPVRIPESEVQVSFPIGSEWLYVKLYCGPMLSDRVLRDLVVPLAMESLERQWADQWFFIRYADPEPHLRVRFKGCPETLMYELLPRITQKVKGLHGDGLVWKLQIDTYEREIRRFGGATAIGVFEKAFWIDSEAVGRLLGVLSGEDSRDLRWRMLLKGMDTILDDWGLDMTAKWLMTKDLAAGFFREFAGTERLKRQILNRYRQERPAIEQCLLETASPTDGLRQCASIFGERSARMRPVAVSLRQGSAPGTGPGQSASVASLLHLHANRMLPSSARAHEAVLYKFLELHYDSLLSRAGRNKRNRLGAPEEPALEVRP